MKTLLTPELLEGMCEGVMEQRGREAFLAGKLVRDCPPLVKKCVQRTYWVAGWRKQRKESKK